MQLTTPSVEDQVEEAFDERQCASRNDRVQHAGAIVAYFRSHTCNEGWMCEAHYHYYRDVLIPCLSEGLMLGGVYGCQHCNQRFSTIEDGIRVWPL
jgi:hypothetical protein